MRKAVAKGECMKHPCRQDCPHRTAECKKDCEAWKAYEAAKREEYERRAEDGNIRDALFKADAIRTRRGCYLSSERMPRHYRH